VSARAIADATGIEAVEVKKILKVLVESGKVRVEGKGRGTAYMWGERR